MRSLTFAMSFRDNGEADDANALMFYSLGRITGGGGIGGRGFSKGRWIRVSVCNSSTFGKGCPTFSASSDQHLQRGLATRIGANRANVHEIAAGEMCRSRQHVKYAAPSAAVFAIIHSSCERAAADTKVLPPPQAGYIKNA